MPSEENNQPAVGYVLITAQTRRFLLNAVSKVQKYSSEHCQNEECPFITTAPLGNIYLTFLEIYTTALAKGLNKAHKAKWK